MVLLRFYASSFSSFCCTCTLLCELAFFITSAVSSTSQPDVSLLPIAISRHTIQIKCVTEVQHFVIYDNYTMTYQADFVLYTRTSAQYMINIRNGNGGESRTNKSVSLSLSLARTHTRAQTHTHTHTHSTTLRIARSPD